MRWAGRRSMSVLWRGLGALGLCVYWPFGLQPTYSEPHEPSAGHHADGLDSLPSWHPERLVPYEFLTSDERRVWTEFEARVR